MKKRHVQKYHLVIAALHDVLLEADRVLDVDIVLHLLGRQPLQLRVKFCHAVLGEEAKKVKAKQLILEWQIRKETLMIMVVGLQLSHVSLKSRNVLLHNLSKKMSKSIHTCITACWAPISKVSRDKTNSFRFASSVLVGRKESLSSNSLSFSSMVATFPLSILGPLLHSLERAWYSATASFNSAIFVSVIWSFCHWVPDYSKVITMTICTGHFSLRF